MRKGNNRMRFVPFGSKLKILASNLYPFWEIRDGEEYWQQGKKKRRRTFYFSTTAPPYEAIILLFWLLHERNITKSIASAFCDSLFSTLLPPNVHNFYPFVAAAIFASRRSWALPKVALFVIRISNLETI